MSAKVEQWRVSTVEGVFETDLETLKQWISEGCVLPTDKVSKGNLNWIDAGRAPVLKGAFNGEPVVVTANLQTSSPPTEAEQDGGPLDHAESVARAPEIRSTSIETAKYVAPSNVCCNHPDTATKYLCRICGAALCGACPNYVGISKIPLCPLCGDLCKPYEEIRTKAASIEFQGSGFGVDDFARAIRYPFQHKGALIFGAMMYGVLTDPNADPKKLEEANKKLNQLRPGAQIAQEAERSKNEQSDPAAGVRSLLPYLGAGIVVVLLFLVGVAWAIFYYPMALAVAGYTQSFASVINPLVGLDTIRRMGATYFKAFGMVLAIQVVSVIVTVVVAKITAPFALPFVGNLPARFIDGSITFYFNLVIACLLGLSLYKCADRLDIAVD